MIDIHKPLLGMWFVEIPVGDWLAAIWRDGESIGGTYRFRYYDHNKPGGPDAPDEKHWYTFEPFRETDDNALAKLNHVAGLLAKEAGTPVDFTDFRGCSVQERIDKLISKPWAYVVTKEPT